MIYIFGRSEFLIELSGIVNLVFGFWIMRAIENLGERLS